MLPIGRCLPLTRSTLLLLAMAFSFQTTSAEEPLSALDAAAQNVEQATAAIKELQTRQDLELTTVLSAMNNKSNVAKNWYLSLAQAIADRNPEQSVKELNQFLPRLSEDSTARYWAFSYLTRNDNSLREEMLESMLADPCLELRYEAVALQLERLTAAADAPVEKRSSAYRELLAAARLPEQVQEVAKQLGELGEKVDLLKHFGFIDSWNTVGPFDNKDQAAFDVSYAPEKDYVAGKLASKLDQKYPGKNGDVEWRSVTTTEDDGGVDLSVAYNKEKGAIIYALGKFDAQADLDCEVRIGSANAVKVWVNGELLIAREVYHTGAQIDQYAAPVHLKAGVNTILIKVCQNEQTEEWAQDFKYQLRFTDSSGFAIQPSR
jgi:hypothetical protein